MKNYFGTSTAQMDEANVSFVPESKPILTAEETNAIIIKYLSVSDRVMAIYQCRQTQLLEQMSTLEATVLDFHDQILAQLALVLQLQAGKAKTNKTDQDVERATVMTSAIENICESIVKFNNAQIKNGKDAFSFHNCSAARKDCLAREKLQTPSTECSK